MGVLFVLGAGGCVEGGLGIRELVKQVVLLLFELYVVVVLVGKDC